MRQLFGLLIFLAASAAHAQQTWDYTGAALTETVGYGAPEQVTSFTGDIVLAQALNPNQANQIVTPISFAFNDGSAGVQPDSAWLASTWIEPQQTQFEFSTANGAITGWNVLVDANTGCCSTANEDVFMQLTTTGDTWSSVINTLACEDPNMVSIDCSGASAVSAKGGTWVDPLTAAPELHLSHAVAALTLLCGGVLVLKSRRRV